MTILAFLTSDHFRLSNCLTFLPDNPYNKVKTWQVASGPSTKASFGCTILPEICGPVLGFSRLDV